MVPLLKPTRPPRCVSPICSRPGAMVVTVPRAANALSTMPEFDPTRPPAVPWAPTLTLPIAQEKAPPCAQLAECEGAEVLVIFPSFWPTRPPALTNVSLLVAFTLATTFPNACELVIVDPGPCCPTRPPTEAFRPVDSAFPVANEFSMKPTERPPTNPFCPTSPPIEANEPPVTSPCACELTIVEPPTLEPTSPPALF